MNALQKTFALRPSKYRSKFCISVFLCSLLKSAHHLFYYCLPLPFAVQVICRVVEVLVTGYAERHQSLLIFCHRNDIKVEELDFSFKPALRWINVGPSLAVGLVHFAEQGFVPFPVDMPMLHSVGNIRRLNHMFDYNCRLATHNILWRFVC